MLNCQEVTRLVSESQEHDLLITERLSLKLHLMMCSACANFNRQIPFLRDTIRAYAKGKDDEGDGDNL